MTVCTPYNDSVSYDAVINYNGVCDNTCTIYNDSLLYNAPILYDGECVAPPSPVSPRRGGGVHYRIYREAEDPRRRREDEEILILKPGRGV